MIYLLYEKSAIYEGCAFLSDRPLRALHIIKVWFRPLLNEDSSCANSAVN